jgi:hypothetical protein
MENIASDKIYFNVGKAIIIFLNFKEFSLFIIIHFVHLIYYLLPRSIHIDFWPAQLPHKRNYFLSLLLCMSEIVDGDGFMFMVVVEDCNYRNNNNMVSIEFTYENND